MEVRITCSSGEWSSFRNVDEIFYRKLIWYAELLKEKAIANTLEIRIPIDTANNFVKKEK